MRIAVVGTQNIGKSSFIAEFTRRWPMYRSPENTYRDKIREAGLPINRETTKHSQTVIRDCLLETAIAHMSDPHVIHDRCVLDNLAYTLYASDQPATDIDGEFIQQSIALTRESVKTFDLIFYLPLTEYWSALANTSAPREQRDNNPEFRKSVDNFFRVFFDDNVHRKGRLFDYNDAPPIIELPGDTAERIILASLYVTPTGDAFEEGSLDLLKQAAAESPSNKMILTPQEFAAESAKTNAIATKYRNGKRKLTNRSR